MWSKLSTLVKKKDCLPLNFLFAAGILANCHIVAEGWDPDRSLDPNITFVSLGSHCEIAVHLNANHLRKAAFPFDWLLTCNHDHFLLLLENDFSFFLDEQNLVQHPTSPYVLENTHYEIEFRHDWPFPDLWTDSARFSQQLQEMKTKYDRRINRFRQLRNYQGKVFFIRVAYDLQNDPNLYWGVKDIEQITPKKAQALKDSLDCYFPNLNFTLVIVNYLEAHASPINGVDKVLELKISKHQKQRDYMNSFKSLINQNND
jgi:Putative papain-like cysteine peptidase (DUF1796)